MLLLNIIFHAALRESEFSIFQSFQISHMSNNRRDFIKKGTSLAAGLSIGAVGSSALASENKSGYAGKKVPLPQVEGPNTPKLTMTVNSNATESNMKWIKQFGCDYVHMGG